MISGALFLFNSSSFAQVGCTNINACNYDGAAVTDDGSCFYIGYFIPGPGIVGPAVRACQAPEGYIFPDQICALNIIIEDDYCLITEWDSVCQAAYEECIGCEPLIFIPAIGTTGPAVIGCFPPTGYIFPDQFCASAVIANDPFCLTGFWDNLCNDAYFECAGCWPVVYIPVLPTTGPAVVACIQPEGYQPTFQEAIAQTIASDPSCLIDWTPGCTAIYESFLTDCIPHVYVPSGDYVGPAILSCADAPAGYEAVFQFECGMSTVMSDPYCLTGEWDSICENINYLCTYSCEDYGCTYPAACNYDPSALCGGYGLCDFEAWYIPGNLIQGPPILACEQPENYNLASTTCVEAIIALDPFCLNNNWDALCQEEYDFCLSGNFFPGCTYPDATNFNFDAYVDDGTCLFEPSTCPGDLNGDLVINTGDLTGILALFGSSCP